MTAAAVVKGTNGDGVGVDRSRGLLLPAIVSGVELQIQGLTDYRDDTSTKSIADRDYIGPIAKRQGKIRIYVPRCRVIYKEYAIDGDVQKQPTHGPEVLREK